MVNRLPELEDEETRRWLVAYGGPDFCEPGQIMVIAFSALADKEWSFEGFIAMLTEVVPAELRSSATVELTGGDDEYGKLTVSYVRQETEREYNLRIAAGIGKMHAEQEREREQYERLRTKFGGK